ncbi:MAG: hypothetical protein GY834_05085 [Bacteroidetes bacterium]|nr:hypothetical protein [Bacteroidota bacterium]
MKRIKYLMILLILIGATSCEVLQQAAELNAFTKCKFRLHTIENLKLAGVKIQHIKSLSDLGLIEAAQVASAIASDKILLDFVLNIQVLNSNQEQGSMNRLVWQLFIDDTKITEGVLNKQIKIPPNETRELPLLLSVDLKEIFTNDSGSSLLNMVLNMVGAGDRPTNLVLRAKPTIIIANREITYPGFITIKNEFNAN